MDGLKIELPETVERADRTTAIWTWRNSEINLDLTAANMANIDTPGYKAVGMDFEAEMRQAMNDVDRWFEPGGVRQIRGCPTDFAVDGLIARPDGNNVSMDRESLNLAEAQLKFKVGVALLRGENQTMMDAIHADK
jgi:flagellar basal-body rod protein FlgB